MNKNFNYWDDDGDIIEDQRLQILNGILAQQKQQEQHQQEDLSLYDDERFS